MMNAEKINMDHEGVEVPDYYGEDGLLHCGVCHEPKEAYLPEGKEWLGRRTHPRMCLCRRTENERMEQRMKQLEHEQEVSRLRAKCFTDKYMNNWTFENDNGLNPKMKEARDYVVELGGKRKGKQWTSPLGWSWNRKIIYGWLYCQCIAGTGSYGSDDKFCNNSK